MLPQIYPIDKSGHKRPLIRTYHGRQGRLSETRLKVLNELVPKYSLSNLGNKQDFRKVFETEDVIIDFGCGMGAHSKWLLDQGEAVIAIDVYTAGICDVVEYADKNKNPNLGVYHGDGIDFLNKNVANESISEVHIYFPDPWPKARHEKRRLFTSKFLELLSQVLVPDGKVLLVTDDENYAVAAQDLIRQSNLFIAEEFTQSVTITGYHVRANELDNEIFKFLLRKRSSVR